MAPVATRTNWTYHPTFFTRRAVPPLVHRSIKSSRFYITHADLSQRGPIQLLVHWGFHCEFWTRRADSTRGIGVIQAAVGRVDGQLCNHSSRLRRTSSYRFRLSKCTLSSNDGTSAVGVTTEGDLNPFSADYKAEECRENGTLRGDAPKEICSEPF